MNGQQCNHLRMARHREGISSPGTLIDSHGGSFQGVVAADVKGLRRLATNDVEEARAKGPSRRMYMHCGSTG
jgi:hypothetical protein